jgi:hypothetical protein
MVLITPVKFDLNPVSSLFREGRTRFFLFLALAANLCSQAERDGEVHN